MTALVLDDTVEAVPPSGWQRVWSVVRLHYANTWNVLVLPWLIFAFIWAANVAVWLIIAAWAGPGRLAGTSWSGSIFYIYIYMGITAAMAMNQTFQFALGFSVTRRDFYLGSIIMFGLHALMFGGAVVALSYLEQWTGGWWIGGHLFSGNYFGTGAFGVRVFTVLASMLVCMFIGGAAGSCYARWHLTGMLGFAVAAAAALLGTAALIGWTDNWGPALRWVGENGITGVSAILLIPAAIAGMCGFFVLRGARSKG